MQSNTVDFQLHFFVKNNTFIHYLYTIPFKPSPYVTYMYTYIFLKKHSDTTAIKTMIHLVHWTHGLITFNVLHSSTPTISLTDKRQVAVISEIELIFSHKFDSNILIILGMVTKCWLPFYEMCTLWYLHFNFPILIK